MESSGSLKPFIADVSDTALWVAVYRARESEREDALFRDPLAGRLAGERGKRIADSMSGSRFTSWSVVIRTCIIDAYIQDLIKDRIDTVVNLGAGLDTRPYRLDLPPALRWVEVDYPHMIDLKQRELANERPKCRLERVGLDLADRDARKSFFLREDFRSSNVLILTEGVIPYLSNEQVVQLAHDLSLQPRFRFWLVDYFSPEIFRHMRSRSRMKQMKNAPFRFCPEDWFGFFNQQGWQVREKRYLGEESEKLGRAIPLPWWAEFLRIFISGKKRSTIRKFSAYVLLEPKTQANSNPE